MNRAAPFVLVGALAWAVHEYRRIVRKRDKRREEPQLKSPFILPKMPDDQGIVRWDWQYVLVLVGLLAFIAIISAVIWS
jgi:hypothetical protein